MNDVVRDELERLEDQAGRLTPGIVIEAARDANSPLHGYFEWDDSIAAENYRTEQARTLIRSVVLQITDEKTSFSCVRYVRDPEVGPKEQGYRSIPSLVSDGQSAGLAVRYEFARAQANLQRAEDIAKALKILPVISTAGKQLAKAAGRVEKFFSEGLSAS